MSKDNSSKRPKSRPESIFDNLKGFSQPIVTKVFGKKNRTCDLVNKNNSDLSSKRENQESSSKRRKVSVSSVDLQSPKKRKDHQEEQQTSNHDSDHLFAIVLPMILDQDFKSFKQPIIIKINKSQLNDFGFTFSFSNHINNDQNYFQISLNQVELTIQILATSETITGLKARLHESISANSALKDLRKIINFSENLFSMKHVPLECPDDKPCRQVLGEKALEKLFNNGKGTQNETVNIGSKNPRDKSSSTDSIIVIEEEEISNSKKQDQRPSSPLSDFTDLTPSEKFMKEFQQSLNELDRKKLIISEHDTTGSIIITMINSLKCVNSILSEKNRQDDVHINTVPEIDDTVKITNKNAIYIEGVIRLELDRYQLAVKKSKPGIPCSFAYQIIRFCFPENYYRDVTLGKKLTTKEEIDELVKARKSNSTIKYPLTYIWGFKDPFNERMVGNFNFQLGQSRVESFIHHLLRKSNIMRYSETLEFKIRDRIIKTLCARNTEYSKSKNSREDENESEDVEGDESCDEDIRSFKSRKSESDIKTYNFPDVEDLFDDI